MKRIGIVCAPGIGDGLIFQIALYQLHKAGWEGVFFHDSLQELREWFPHTQFAKRPCSKTVVKTFSSFDALFLQHDNSPLAEKIQALNLPVYTFYGTHHPKKHPPLQSDRDFVCNRNSSMVENLVRAIQKLFHLPEATSDNGIQVPARYLYRRYPKRVAIAPLSQKSQKNWPVKRFIQLKQKLHEWGLFPTFLVPPDQTSSWESPLFPTLQEAAGFLYESGFFIGNDSALGHLASCLGIPFLIIGKKERELRLWKPGWSKGTLITPPWWIPNWKGWRLREHYWQRWISVRKVLREFKKKVVIQKQTLGAPYERPVSSYEKTQS